MTQRLRIVLFLLALQLGCNGDGPPAGDPALSHVRLVSLFYNKVASDLGRPPKDEQEFKQALANTQISLETLQLDSLDEVFLSERDGQPLVIAYGGPPAGSDVVVYEQTGVDGKRLVAHRIGEVEEVDEARFSELVPRR